MRYLFLIPLLLISLCIDVAAQPAGKDYADMPVAEWLRLPYRMQIRSTQEIASLNRLGMCRKQTAELVNCMRAIGTSQAWKGSTAGNLLMECSFDTDKAPGPGERK